MLEDDFSDIIRKARFGLSLQLPDVARAAGVAMERLQALEAAQVEPQEEEVLTLARVLGLRASALVDIAFGRYSPAVSAGPVNAVHVPDGNAFAYALEIGGARVAVDAGGSVPQMRRALAGAPDAVFLTHGHADHVAALAELRGSAAVFAHPALASRLPGVRSLQDGEEVFGLTVRFAPGHSADMLTLVGDGVAFVGDTLFAGSLGRAQTAQNYQELLASARRILALPGETLLFCGHGPVTRVAEERVHNAFDVA